MVALVLAVACLTVGVRSVRAQDAQDKVTVEVTRDEQGSITRARVLSGPEYLRPLALMATLQQAVQAHAMKLPTDLRVRTLTFPDAFAGMDNQQTTVRQFLEDEVAQAKKDVETIYRTSPDDRDNLKLAQQKLEEILKKQALAMRNEAGAQRPEKMWKVQVLRHEMDAFRMQYQGKLQGNNDATLQARYAQIQQDLAAAEKELEVLSH
jgi:hypothetical protein